MDPQKENSKNEEEKDQVDQLPIDLINPNEVLQEEEIDKDKEMDICDEDNNIDIPDPSTESFQQEFPNFSTKGEIYCVALHQTKGIAIIGDGDDTTTFFDLESKKVISSKKYNTDSVNILKFSSDEKYLASTSIDGTVNIFDANNNFTLLSTIKDNDVEINWLDWHPKGPAFAFGTYDGSVWVYMANNISNTFNFFSHTKSTTCGMFSRDGKLLISAGEDCALKVYDLKNKSVLHTVKGKKYHQGNITCISIAMNKTIVATGSQENEFSLVNYENGNVLYYTSFNDKNQQEISIEAIEFCNEDKFIVYADSNGKVNIFDMSMMQIRAAIDLDGDNITKIIPSNVRKYEVYAGGSNGEIYIIDTRAKGSVVQKEKVHRDVIMDFVVTKNEEFILTSSLDKSINLLKVISIN